MPSNPRPNPSLGLELPKGPLCYVATSANITYGKLYIIGKSKLCWLQTRVNDVGRLSGREDMSKTKLALNPRLRLQIFRVTVKRPSKVGQRKVRSLVRNRNIGRYGHLRCLIDCSQAGVQKNSVISFYETWHPVWL